MASIPKPALVPILLALLALMGQSSPERDLVWPSGPERPRIRHLSSFSGKSDLEIERSWWQAVIAFIFGSEEESGAMIRPQAVAVDGAGRIFVADPGARGVHVYDRAENEYEFRGNFGGEGFLSPVGIALTDDGTCFVTDSEKGIVAVFDGEGEYQYAIRNGLSRPTGIAVRGDKLYITDTGNHQVVVCDLRGNIELRIGRRGVGESEFNYPVYLAVAPGQTNDSAASLYVVDGMNFRVQLLTAKGRFISALGAQGTSAGSFANPKGIAVDSDGHLFIADALLDAVQIFDGEGSLLLVFGVSGGGRGEFSLPAGLWIDRDDKVYVADALNRRVQIFQYLAER